MTQKVKTLLFPHFINVYYWYKYNSHKSPIFGMVLFVYRFSFFSTNLLPLQQVRCHLQCRQNRLRWAPLASHISRVRRSSLQLSAKDGGCHLRCHSRRVRRLERTGHSGQGQSDLWRTLKKRWEDILILLDLWFLLCKRKYNSYKYNSNM